MNSDRKGNTLANTILCAFAVGLDFSWYHLLSLTISHIAHANLSCGWGERVESLSSDSSTSGGGYPRLSVWASKIIALHGDWKDNS